MNRLKDSGRWLLTTLFGVSGLWCLWWSIVQVPEILAWLRKPPVASPTGGGQLGVFFDARLIVWLPFLLAAWGIFKWRAWGHILAVVLCVLTLYVLVPSFFLMGPSRFSVTLALTAIMILAWLQLPIVRAQFYQKNRGGNSSAPSR